MIRVVQFIHGLNMGGAETLVKDYVLGLDKEKFEVVVLCYEKYDSPYPAIIEKAGIKIVNISDDMPLYGNRNTFSRLINRISVPILLRRKIRQLRPDVIHEHLPLNRYLRFVRPSKGTSIFFTQHFQVSRWTKNYPKDIEAAKWLMKSYPMKLIALNNSMKEEMNSVFSTNDTVVLNNGIDMKRFKEALPKNLVRNKIGISQNAFVVGHVGRFSEIKNHKFLVEIFAEIAKKNENAFLLMVGNGDTIDSIKIQLNQLGVEDKTLILSNRTDVPDLMTAMDVMVFPSFSEGMPVTLVEAQVSELPCMVSDSISTATKISNLIRYMSLNKTAEAWADEILAWNKEEPEYYDVEKWDMKQIICQLEDMYIASLGNKTGKRL